MIVVPEGGSIGQFSTKRAQNLFMRVVLLNRHGGDQEWNYGMFMTSTGRKRGKLI